MALIKSKIIGILITLFSKEIATIFIAALPVLELRAAIPISIIKFHFSIPKAYLLSLIGNLLPVIPLLFLFKFFFHKLEHIRFIGNFFKWWFESVRRRSKIVERWGFWGLVIFVSIPLPITGAWTGTVAATLFNIKTKSAFFAIALGIILAGIIVALLCIFGKLSWGYIS